MANLQGRAKAQKSKHEELIEGLTKTISKMQPHQKLLPERQLAENWQVSRMTLRRALEALQTKGMIYTIPSSGLYVAEPKLVKTSDATSLSEITRHRGTHPRALIHLADKIKADAEIADSLEIDIGQVVYRIEQTFLDDKIPLATETAYVVVDLAKGLIEHDLTQSLSSLLNDHFEKPIKKVRYRVRAVVPDDRFLNRLSLEPGAPVLEFCASGITTNERVIFYVVSYKRGDKYDLAYEIDLA